MKNESMKTETTKNKAKKMLINLKIPYKFI